MQRDRKLFIATQHDPRDEWPETSRIYRVGLITRIRQILNPFHAGYKVLVEGIRRARILSYETEDPFYDVSVRSMRAASPVGGGRIAF